MFHQSWYCLYDVQHCEKANSNALGSQFDWIDMPPKITV